MEKIIALSFLLLIGSVYKSRTEINDKAIPPINKQDAVKSFKELMPYTGRIAVNQIPGKDRQKAYLLNYEQLKVNYGNNVEFQLRSEQVILCPQTVDFLYSKFTQTITRYHKGTRPELEKVVTEITSGCKTEREKILAIMRFCRDLYKKNPDAKFPDYIYGGTEEQLIAKPDVLCETLSRLMVSLCEVIGIPGRIVMHDIGGHVCTEILIDGHWGYIDPRTGIYFLKRDNSFASVRELCRDPSIINLQSNDVKADVSDQWTWEYRAWKCQNLFFNPNEVNGFQNYSLADTKRYIYSQLSEKEATAAGLYIINEQYISTIRKVFGLTEDWDKNHWGIRKLKNIPLTYRHDGFSPYFKEFLITREYLEQNYIDCFKNTNTKTLEWGLGPGSVFCFETKVGQIFGKGLSNEQLGLLRIGDRWVNQNVNNLIKEGGPLHIAVERSHKLGLEIFARLEMNHEYGPADPGNWKWVALVGDFNKKHPEYRIGKSVMLDFKHEEVRNFKIAILREAAETGVDGISMDFAVYPPFFEKPDTSVMTQFIRDVRKMLDKVGKQQGRHIKLMTRVPFEKYMEIGLDWKTWMNEKLIDIIVPTHYRAADYFDIPVEEFVDLAKKTGASVYPTIWQALGFTDTDPQPGDEKTGRKRYDKPKTEGMFYAQAILFHRACADGLELGFSDDQWSEQPWLNNLSDFAKVEVANKHYMVDPAKLRPGTFKDTGSGTKCFGQRTVGLRIGDNIPEAHKKGYSIASTLVVYMRTLQPGEKLEVFVNGNGPVVVSGDSDDEKKRRDTDSTDDLTQKSLTFVFEADWWKRTMHEVPVNSDWWRLENNEIKMVYSATSVETKPELSITWIDLLLDYGKKNVLN